MSIEPLTLIWNTAIALTGASLLCSFRFLAHKKLKRSAACLALASACFLGSDVNVQPIAVTLAAAAADELQSDPSLAAIQPGTLTPEEASKQWKQILAHASAPPRGRANARYSIVLFGDFQCPSCAKINPSLMASLKKSHGKVNLYFVDRPFMMQHKYALPAAQAAREAAAEGKFWPMYDILFENQDDLEPGNYAEYAKKIGANPRKIAAAAHDEKLAAKVKECAKFCDKLPVSMTPTVIVMDNQSHNIVAVTARRTDIEIMLANPVWH